MKCYHLKWLITLIKLSGIHCIRNVKILSKRNVKFFQNKFFFVSLKKIQETCVVMLLINIGDISEINYFFN